MSESTAPMDLLVTLGGLGIDDPLPATVDERSRAALAAEITRSSTQRLPRPLRRPVRRLTLVLAALLTTGAVAAAATVVTHGFNFAKIAQHNVHDTPLQLFERNPDVTGATPASKWRQTVIASSVRKLGTFTVAGIGPVQYWVANTRQHGICGALRTANGEWIGLQDKGQDGGEFPGCYPTRAQIGAGALIIDGFDFLNTSASRGTGGQRWYFLYGEVSTDQTLARVRDTFSGTDANLVSGHYFAIALHPVGNDYGDDIHLEAFDAAGQRIATLGKPVAGSINVRCVGRYNVRRVRIPHTHRFSVTASCRHYVRYVVK